jgi:hypothetical protein
MKKAHVLITIGLIGAVALGWHLAHRSNQTSIAAVQVERVTEPSALSGLHRLYAGSWGRTLSVHPDMEKKNVTPPVYNGSTRKALEQLSTELRLPLACVEEELAEETPIYIHPVAILCGTRSPELERALDALHQALDSERPERLHDLAELSDPRVESILHWSLTQSQDPAQRGAAAFGLGTAQQQITHQALVSALADVDELVRDQARSAIQQVGGLKMEAHLRKAMLSANKEQALEAGDLLENALGLEVDPEFWARFTD